MASRSGRNPKDWTIVVLDVGSTMCYDGASRREAALHAARLLLQEKMVNGKTDPVGVILVGSGTYNRLDAAHIVEVGSWADQLDSGHIEPVSAELFQVITSAASLAHSETRGDIAVAIQLAVDAIRTDVRFDVKKHNGRVVVITDAETKATDAVGLASARAAVSSHITIDVLLVDPQHSNAAAVQPDALDVPGPSDSDPMQDGSEGAGGSLSHASSITARKGLSVRDGARERSEGGRGSSTLMQPTHDKMRTVLLLTAVATESGGRVCDIANTGESVPIVAVSKLSSGAKPYAPLTLAGKAIANVTVYGYVMPAKPPTFKTVSEPALNQAAEEHSGDLAQEGEGGDAVGARNTGQGAMEKAGVVRDRHYVREATESELAAAADEGNGGSSAGVESEDALARRYVDENSVLRAYVFGGEMVPMSAEVEKATLKLPDAQAELEVLAFVPMSRIARYLYMGNPFIIVPQQQSGQASQPSRVAGQVAMQALVNTLATQGKGALVRHRHNRISSPGLYLAFPASNSATQDAGVAGVDADPGSAGGVDVDLDVGTCSSSSGPGRTGAGLQAGGDPGVPMSNAHLTGPAYEHPPPPNPVAHLGLPALFMVQLPWNEDIRPQYVFDPPFTRDAAGSGAPGVPQLSHRTGGINAAAVSAASAGANTGLSQQLSAMDALIDALDLTRLPAYGATGFQPQNNVNPRINAYTNTVVGRLIDPNCPLAGPDPWVLAYTDHTRVREAAGNSLDMASGLVAASFTLKAREGSKVAGDRGRALDDRVSVRLEALAGNKRSREGEWEQGAASASTAVTDEKGKHAHEVDDEAAGEDPNAPSSSTQPTAKRTRTAGPEIGGAALIGGPLGGRNASSAESGHGHTVIGTGRPVEDFRRAMAEAEAQSDAPSAGGGPDYRLRALNGLIAVALALSADEHEMHVQKVLDCINALREVAQTHGYEWQFNAFLRSLKARTGPTACPPTGRRVWRKVVAAQLTLLHDDADRVGTAEAFLLPPEAQVPDTVAVLAAPHAAAAEDDIELD